MRIRLNVYVQAVNNSKKLILIRQISNKELAKLILQELQKNNGVIPCVIEVDKNQLSNYINFFN